MIELFIRYAHFISIILLSATLFAEHLLITPQMETRQFKKLARIDGIYGVSALIVLVAGLLLWFYVGKPSTFYSANWVFHLKLAIFLLIGLLSLIPTVFILRQRKTKTDSIDIPKYIIHIVRVEMLLLLILPLLAVTMASGYGLG